MRLTGFAFVLVLLLLALAAWNLVSTTGLLSSPRPEPGCENALSCGAIVYRNAPERVRVLGLINKIKSQTDMLQLDNEAYQIFMGVQRTTKIKGAVAEVGVYKGGSAKLICEAKGSKPLYLFDTFLGTPEVKKIDERPSAVVFAASLRELQTASLEEAQANLRDCQDVYFYKGWFPHSADDRVKNAKFSFVHLDVDGYESTLQSLQFFYSRLTRGGIIISHDYIWIPGVRKAVDEFFRDKPEPVLELSGTQCLIVKL